MQAKEHHPERVAVMLSVQEDKGQCLELSLFEGGCVLWAGQKLERGKHVEQVESQNRDHRQAAKRHDERKGPADRSK